MPHSTCCAGSACAVRFVCTPAVAHTHTAAAAALVRVRRAYKYAASAGYARALVARRRYEGSCGGAALQPQARQGRCMAAGALRCNPAPRVCCGAALGRPLPPPGVGGGRSAFQRFLLCLVQVRSAPLYSLRRRWCGGGAVGRGVCSRCRRHG
eukprot:10710059-Alexandrium_andersonii.AAC.1